MEFYRTFSYLTKDNFTELINYMFFEKKEISKTMNTAIILLIPKTTAEKTNIAKWRPISLSCVHYKIITKIIKNRLLLTLNEIISSDDVIYMTIFLLSEIW